MMFLTAARKSSFLLLILLFAAPAFAQTAGANPQSQAALVTEFDVNGMKVLVKQRASSSTVAVGLFVRGGVKNAAAATAGLEQLMLNAAIEASAAFPRETVRRELSRTGTQIGASSNYDYSGISMATTRANFDRSFEIFSDLALNPAFAPEDVERVREQTLAGLRERSSSPDAFLGSLGEQAAFAKHPYAVSPEGTIESVSKFQAEDLRRSHAAAMQSSRLLLVIVGDLDAERIKIVLAATFGKLPRGNYQEKTVAALNFAAPALEITNRQLPTNYIQGIFAAPSPLDADIYPMRVATEILQSRVFEEVRVKRNLSYAPTASLDSRAANTGAIYVTAVKANEAIGVMLDEIATLQNKTVDDEELKAILGGYLTTFYIGQETNIAQVGTLASNELIGGGWRNSFLFLDKVRRVTAKDVQRVAKKYMRNIRFVVLGNPKDINRKIFIRETVQPLTIPTSK